MVSRMVRPVNRRQRPDLDRQRPTQWISDVTSQHAHSRPAVDSDPCDNNLSALPVKTSADWRKCRILTTPSHRRCPSPLLASASVSRYRIAKTGATATAAAGALLLAECGNTALNITWSKARVGRNKFRCQISVYPGRQYIVYQVPFWRHVSFDSRCYIYISPDVYLYMHSSSRNSPHVRNHVYYTLRSRSPCPFSRLKGR